MKRIAIVVAGLVVALGLAGPVPSATAAEPACEFSVPEVPGECLTEPVFTFIGTLGHDLYVASSHYEVASVQLSACGTLRDQFAAEVNVIASLHDDLGAKYALRGLRVERQKAKIAELRRRLKAASALR